MADVEGVRLSRCGHGAWIADRELVFSKGTRLPIRMVVLETTPGSLSLYSPVALDEGTLEAVDGLGEVRHIVVPNRFHTLFASAAADHYPHASLLVPATIESELRASYGARVETVDSRRSLSPDCEIFPVTLRSGMEELVVYHDGAELLVVADMLLNIQQGGFLLRWLLKLNGAWRRPAQSRLQRLLMMRDRQRLALFYRWAMAKPFSVISMSHGQTISDEAREVFYQLFHGYAEG
jgi:hypothetical protein